MRLSVIIEEGGVEGRPWHLLASWSDISHCDALRTVSPTFSVEVGPICPAEFVVVAAAAEVTSLRPLPEPPLIAAYLRIFETPEWVAAVGLSRVLELSERASS